MKIFTEEMIKIQKGFFENIKPYTEWFDKKWKREKIRLLEELKNLTNTY